MFLGVKTIRERIADNIRIALEEGNMSEKTNAVLKDWLDNVDNGEGTRQRAENLRRVLEEENSDIAKEILNPGSRLGAVLHSG